MARREQAEAVGKCRRGGVSLSDVKSCRLDERTRKGCIWSRSVLYVAGEEEKRCTARQARKGEEGDKEEINVSLLVHR